MDGEFHRRVAQAPVSREPNAATPGEVRPALAGGRSARAASAPKRSPGTSSTATSDLGSAAEPPARAGPRCQCAGDRTRRRAPTPNPERREISRQSSGARSRASVPGLCGQRNGGPFRPCPAGAFRSRRRDTPIRVPPCRGRLCRDTDADPHSLVLTAGPGDLLARPPRILYFAVRRARLQRQPRARAAAASAIGAATSPGRR